jgi:hypothetical protein
LRNRDEDAAMGLSTSDGLPRSSANKQSGPLKKKSKGGRPSVYDKKIQALGTSELRVERSGALDGTCKTIGKANQSIKRQDVCKTTERLN